MSIKKMLNYNTGIDLSAISISEATYMLNSFIEESINDLQIKCLLADKRSLQESGIRYFTEENEVGKKKLGEKIKQIIKTVWDAIVGIFKKLRDFFKDMIEKMKEFFEKIKNKIFGKKKQKEEPKAAAEKKNSSKPEEKEDPKNRQFNTEKLNTTQDEHGLHKADQKELVEYMENLDDKVFREAIDKNVTKYYDVIQLGITQSDWLIQATFDIQSNDIDHASELIDRTRKFLSNPLPEANKSSITKAKVLGCAFGNFGSFYEAMDSTFENLKKSMDPFLKRGDELDPKVLSLVKDNLKLITTFSQKYSSAMIHNSKELMKVVHYIYNNYDRDGVSVKESVDWGSIL